MVHLIPSQGFNDLERHSFLQLHVLSVLPVVIEDGTTLTVQGYEESTNTVVCSNLENDRLDRTYVSS